VKTGVNPTIVSVLKTYKGNSIDLAGKKLQDILPRLKREVIDCLVEVEFKASASRVKKSDGNNYEVYRPKGAASKIKETFRLVGVLDEETGEYHLFITDIMPEQLSPEDVALLYRARWSIELIFKELKRLYKLDDHERGA
jgi:putative transposase